MKKLILCLIVWIIHTSISSQSCNVLSDDYSNPNLWNKFSATNVNQIFIHSGAVRYNNSLDGHEERLYRTLPSALSSTDNWTAEVDFFPAAAGTYNTSGHLPLTLTAGSLDPLSNCSNPANCGPNQNYTNQNQDGIIVFFGTNPPPFSSIAATFFQLHVKDGKSEWNSRIHASQVIYAPLKHNYHIMLEKCDDMIRLHVSEAGNALPGSPITYVIPSNVSITGLNTIQHTNSSRGVNSRSLSAVVDNLCISKQVNHLPELSGTGNPLSTDYSYTFFTCQSNQCFSIYSKDQDPWQTLTLTMLSGLPTGASFNQSNQKHPVGTFCWDPGKSDVGIHYFQVKVEDDHCDNASRTYTYRVEVKEGYDLGYPIQVCNYMPPISLPDPGPGLWHISSPMTQALSGNLFDPAIYAPGIYTLSYCTPAPNMLAKCVGCWTLQIEVLASPKISISGFETFCSTDQPRQLSATPSGGVWSGGPYISPSGIFNPSASNIGGFPSNSVTYTVNWPNGCFDSKSIDIPVYINGSTTTTNLGEICEDEFLVLEEGAKSYKLIEILDPATGTRPPNLPSLPITLSGHSIHFGQIAPYIFTSSGYTYTIEAIFMNSHGCEFKKQYTFTIISCACEDSISQFLAINATPLNAFLSYQFSFTPNFSLFPNLLRVNWIITDVNRNVLKVLYAWNASSGLPGASSFQYDFTPYFGTIFPCGYYNVFLQLTTVNEFGELSLCEEQIVIPICDGEPELPNSKSNKEVEPVDYLSELKIELNPSLCENAGQLIVESSIDRQCNIEIYSTAGRLVYRNLNMNLNSGKNQLEIDCKSFEKGIHVIRIGSEDIVQSLKFLVK
ncbi:MAG: T9SS type A sorting domain-containing protein [Vicingaceae bacterium]